MTLRAGADECWEWQGFKHKGYGRIRIGANAVGAHRVRYQLENGPIPDGLTVLHRCDNPGCNNPAHLFLGTNLDNNRDRDAKQRQARGDRAPTAKLTEDAVRRLRSGALNPSEAAAYYGVTDRTITAAKAGITWRHL